MYKSLDSIPCDGEEMRHLLTNWWLVWPKSLVPSSPVDFMYQYPLLWPNTSRGKGFFWSMVLRMEFNLEEWNWWREHRVAGHFVKGQETERDGCWCSVGFLLFCLLFSVGPQPLEWCHPHPVWVFSLSSLETSSQTYPEVCFLGDPRYT